MDIILSDIYDSEDFHCMGLTIRNSDNFIVPYNGELYMVLIMETTGLYYPNEENLTYRYNYALYFFDRAVYIPQNTNLYKKITKKLPSLKRVNSDGGAFDFMEVCRLKDVLQEIVNQIRKNGGLTKEILEQYRQYLVDQKKMQPKSFQKIYNYFENLSFEI